MYDLYVCNEDDSSRFILGKDGHRMLFVIGLNPSTATQEKSDATVAKVEKVAIKNGFDGFVMANLYPLRSTKPRALPEHADPNLLSENRKAVCELAKKKEGPVFWAAWGVHITLRPYLFASLGRLAAEVSRIGGRWENFGSLCKGEHPRHPSRLSYDWVFSPFDCEGYLRSLQRS